MTSRLRYYLPIAWRQHVVSKTEEDAVSGSLEIAWTQVHTTVVSGTHALHLTRLVIETRYAYLDASDVYPVTPRNLGKLKIQECPN
jgi:hypothetical protein